MSNFLKMFRSKKADKENDSTIDEEQFDGTKQAVQQAKKLHERKPICRNGNAYNSTRKDRRSSVVVGFDDTFLKPSAPYHTVTQPKQTKGSRSCVGRDEYERYGHSRSIGIKDHSFKGSSTFGRRKLYELKLSNDYSSIKASNYDDELLDSDDSFVSEDDRRATRYRNEVVRDLKEEVEYLKYRLRRESEKKLAYKEKLICEQRNMQKILNQRQRMEYDINIYKNLLANLRNEKKAHQAKIIKLEAQLKSVSSRNITQRSFGNNTFATPTSTSNDLSSVDEAVMDIDGGAGEMLCSASELTLPIQNTFDSVADSVDEVKNFRKDDTNSSFELARTEAETGIEKIDLDSTLLNETETEHLSSGNDCALKSVKLKQQQISAAHSSLRRSLSDTDIKKKRRNVAFKMTNL